MGKSIPFAAANAFAYRESRRDCLFGAFTSLYNVQIDALRCSLQRRLAVDQHRELSRVDEFHVSPLAPFDRD
jgi:hypothetical protein